MNFKAFTNGLLLTAFIAGLPMWYTYIGVAEAQQGIKEDILIFYFEMDLKKQQCFVAGIIAPLFLEKPVKAGETCDEALQAVTQLGGPIDIREMGTIREKTKIITVFGVVMPVNLPAVQDPVP